LTEVLAEQGRSSRLLSQCEASSTSVGANGYEADEALSRADFAKCVGIMLKELNETRFWLHIFARRKWVSPTRLEALLREAEELKKVLGAIHTRTKKRSEPRR
jgi:four helix bundle protein